MFARALVAAAVLRAPAHLTRVSLAICRGPAIGVTVAAHAVSQLPAKRVGAVRVELERRERPTESGEWTRQRSPARAELDNGPAGRVDELDDAIDDTAVDKEVLAELVPASDVRRRFGARRGTEATLTVSRFVGRRTTGGSAGGRRVT
jgi:hypothetical protein